MLFILFTKKKRGGGGGGVTLNSFVFLTVNDNSFDSFHFNRATFMLDLLH